MLYSAQANTPNDFIGHDYCRCLPSLGLNSARKQARGSSRVAGLAIPRWRKCSKMPGSPTESIAVGCTVLMIYHVSLPRRGRSYVWPCVRGTFFVVNRKYVRISATEWARSQRWAVIARKRALQERPLLNVMKTNPNCYPTITVTRLLSVY